MNNKKLMALLLLGSALTVQAEEVPVKTEPVVASQQAFRHTAQGIVESPDRTLVSTSHAARLDWIARPGVRVNKGDIVARLDSFFLNNQLAQNRLAGDAAANDIRYYQSELDRLTALKKSSHVADNRLDEISYQLNAAKIRQQQAEVDRARLSEYLQRSELTATVDGVITRRFAQAGSYAEVGDALVEIVSRSDNQIAVDLPVEFANLVTPGDRVKLRHKHWQGSALISRIIDVASPESQAYRLFLSPDPESARQLMVGTRVDVDLDLGATTGVLIPQDAIVLESEGYFVYQIKDKTANKLKVEVLGSRQGYLIIDGPLQSGDDVVIRGAGLLSDGASVRL